MWPAKMVFKCHMSSTSVHPRNSSTQQTWSFKELVNNTKKESVIATMIVEQAIAKNVTS